MSVVSTASFPHPPVESQMGIWCILFIYLFLLQCPIITHLFYGVAGIGQSSVSPFTLVHLRAALDWSMNYPIIFPRVF